MEYLSIPYTRSLFPSTTKTPVPDGVGIHIVDENRIATAATLCRAYCFLCSKGCSGIDYSTGSATFKLEQIPDNMPISPLC